MASPLGHKFRLAHCDATTAMKTLATAILGLFVSLALLEGLCQGYYLLKNGSPYDSGRILGALGAATGPAASGERLPDLFSDQREVLHPYAGYVRDYNADFRAHFGYDTNASPLSRRAPDRLTIALFGGSVAMHLHQILEAAFAKALSAGGDPRRVVLVNFALGGYKQPQQLMALDYFLALGASFDAVINLDGFNEIVLPVTDNLPQGVSPYYPRLWDMRVSDSLDPEKLKTLAAIAADREKLAAVVAGLRGPVLSRSAAWGLWAGWRVAGLQRDIAARNASLEKKGDKPYVQSGPPFDKADSQATLASLARFWARCSRLMQAASTASGSAYYHFLQPNQYVAGSKPLSPEEKRTAYAPDEAYGRAASLGYPALFAAGRELATEGVPYIDATGIFKDHPETLYSDTCCHLNPAGYGILADFIVGRVLPALPRR